MNPFRSAGSRWEADGSVFWFQDNAAAAFWHCSKGEGAKLLLGAGTPSCYGESRNVSNYWEQTTESEDDGPEGFGVPRVQDVLNYRKVAVAVVATYLGLEDAFVESVLEDRMDEWLEEQALAREHLKDEQYQEYLYLLSRETIVRYAATAAETLVASPDSALAQGRVMGDTGVLGFTDDVNAVVRVHEIFEYLESPDGSEEADQILLFVKRQLCNYYNACAFELVKNHLLSVIISGAEEFYRKGSLSAARVRELVIAAENDG